MKTPRCPLCGEMPEYVLFLVGEEECDHICCKCGLCTSPISSLLGKTQCWKDWSELVAKFPPIMKVWPGDKLQVEDGSICEVINVNKNLAMMDVRRGEGRPVFTIADTHVLRWPWEIEQKGDTE